MNKYAKMMNENLIFSKNNQKVLSFLCDHPNDSFYSNQIAEKVSLSKGGVSQTLRSLAKERLLKFDKKGKMVFYQADSSCAVIRQFKVLRHILLLNPLIRKLQSSTDKALLFGSCAEGTDTEDSDVDLLVVSHHKADVQNILTKFKSKRKIQLILKSPQEYVGLETKEPVFFSEIEKGILLWQRI